MCQFILQNIFPRWVRVLYRVWLSQLRKTFHMDGFTGVRDINQLGSLSLISGEPQRLQWSKRGSFAVVLRESDDMALLGPRAHMNMHEYYYERGNVTRYRSDNLLHSSASLGVGRHLSFATTLNVWKCDEEWDILSGWQWVNGFCEHVCAGTVIVAKAWCSSRGPALGIVTCLMSIFRCRATWDVYFLANRWVSILETALGINDVI